MKKKIACVNVSILLVTTILTAMAGLAGAAAPDIPNTPDGSMIAGIGELCEFSVDGVNDSDGDDVFYLFDWGDGTDTGWIGPYQSEEGPIEAEKIWNKFGEYNIRVKAKDDGDVESAFSDPLTITITLPMPDGPTEGSKNELYEFSIEPVNGTNFGGSDDHDILYLFDWGDGFNTGWIGPYPSNEGPDWYEIITAEHKWTEQGYYEIKVKAKDNTTGDETEFSEPLIINIGHRFAIGAINGGFGVSASIENTLEPSKYVDYTIEISGGSLTGFHVQKLFSDTIYIKSGTSETVATSPFFALGRVKITVTAKCSGEPDTAVSKSVEGRVFFFYVML